MNRAGPTVLAQRRDKTQHMEEITDGTKEHRPMFSHTDQHRLVFGGEWETQCFLSISVDKKNLYQSYDNEF